MNIRLYLAAAINAMWRASQLAAFVAFVHKGDMLLSALCDDLGYLANLQLGGNLRQHFVCPGDDYMLMVLIQ